MGRGRKGAGSLHSFGSTRAPLTCLAGAVGRFLAASWRPPKRRSTRATVARSSQRGQAAPATARTARCAPLGIHRVRTRRRSWARRAEVGVQGLRAGEVRLPEEGAAGARPHRASQAIGSPGGAARGAPEARWPASCTVLLRRERLEQSEPSGPAAPAAWVPWKRARRPPAPAPPERLKRQPCCHRGLDALLGVPHPPAPSSPPPLHASAAGTRSGGGWAVGAVEEAAGTQNQGFR